MAYPAQGAGKCPGDHRHRAAPGDSPCDRRRLYPIDRVAVALALTAEELARAETSGAILMVLDDRAPDAIAGIATLDLPPVTTLIAAPDTFALLQLDALSGDTIVRVTPDDLDRIEPALTWACRAAQA